MAHPPPRWWWLRRVILFAIVIVAGGGALWIWLRGTRDTDCATASRAGLDSVTVLVCRREYERTKLPVIGARFADALRRTNDLQGAMAVANDLLTTDVRADALQILGKIAFTQGRIDEANQRLQDARRLHREQGNRAGLAQDDQALAGVQERQEHYTESLQTLDECIVEAHAAPDERTEGLCSLSAAQVLVSVGYFDAARRELDRAAQYLSTDRDVAQLWLERGSIDLELVRLPPHRAYNEQAAAAFERGLVLAQRAKNANVARRLHLKLAYALAEIGRTDEAERHLADGAILDSGDLHRSERAQLAARIAYRRHNLELAFSLNEKLYPGIEEDDERIDVCVMQARIALEWNKLALAEQWAKRGVDTAEHVRSEQTASELRSWVLATRREPFELLFTALARNSRFDEAVVVFDQWQGRTLLDAMARASADPSLGLSSTATQIRSLGTWLPAASQAPLITSDGSAGVRTLRKIDLIALAEAEDRLWRLTASRGKVRLEDLGSIDAFRDALDRFTNTPTDPALASELGARLLPDDVVRRTDEPLSVVLDAPLGTVPVIALRRNDEPLIAYRPVLRTPRLPATTGCELRSDAGSALVIADAAGDLPDARRESNEVASLFQTTPFVGPAATSTALFAAKSDPLLHVAVHAEIDAGGGVLKLHDRAVSAAEISANKLGPSLVVLSACSTARSWDPELAGSLSTAFLAGGSRQVIATLRPVSDTGALELTRKFYEARGATDPVRALAGIQASLAHSDNKEWPNFAIFGVCSPRP